uniref:Uncharacterized protein n=1 Tax=Clastoptera arizonana TaxID=38151 RepID=A0A1B6DDH2_9HEMI
MKDFNPVSEDFHLHLEESDEDSNIEDNIQTSCTSRNMMNKINECDVRTDRIGESEPSSLETTNNNNFDSKNGIDETNAEEGLNSPLDKMLHFENNSNDHPQVEKLIDNVQVSNGLFYENVVSSEIIIDNVTDIDLDLDKEIKDNINLLSIKKTFDKKLTSDHKINGQLINLAEINKFDVSNHVGKKTCVTIKHNLDAEKNYTNNVRPSNINSCSYECSNTINEVNELVEENCHKQNSQKDEIDKNGEPCNTSQETNFSHIDSEEWIVLDEIGEKDPLSQGSFDMGDKDSECVGTIQFHGAEETAHEVEVEDCELDVFHNDCNFIDGYSTSLINTSTQKSLNTKSLNTKGNSENLNITNSSNFNQETNKENIKSNNKVLRESNAFLEKTNRIDPAGEKIDSTEETIDPTGERIDPTDYVSLLKKSSIVVDETVGNKKKEGECFINVAETSNLKSVSIDSDMKEESVEGKQVADLSKTVAAGIISVNFNIKEKPKPLLFSIKENVEELSNNKMEVVEESSINIPETPAVHSRSIDSETKEGPKDSKMTADTSLIDESKPFSVGSGSTDSEIKETAEKAKESLLIQMEVESKNIAESCTVGITSINSEIKDETENVSDVNSKTNKIINEEIGTANISTDKYRSTTIEITESDVEVATLNKKESSDFEMVEISSNDIIDHKMSIDIETLVTEHVITDYKMSAEFDIEETVIGDINSDKEESIVLDDKKCSPNITQSNNEKSEFNDVKITSDSAKLMHLITPKIGSNSENLKEESIEEDKPVFNGGFQICNMEVEEIIDKHIYNKNEDIKKDDEITRNKNIEDIAPDILNKGSEMLTCLQNFTKDSKKETFSREPVKDDNNVCSTLMMELTSKIESEESSEKIECAKSSNEFHKNILNDVEDGSDSKNDYVEEMVVSSPSTNQQAEDASRNNSEYKDDVNKKIITCSDLLNISGISAVEDNVHIKIASSLKRSYTDVDHELVAKKPRISDVTETASTVDIVNINKECVNPAVTKNVKTISVKETLSDVNSTKDSLNIVNNDICDGMSKVNVASEISKLSTDSKNTVPTKVIDNIDLAIERVVQHASSSSSKNNISVLSKFHVNQLKNLTRHELEDFVLAKFCEAIAYKSEVGELRQRCVKIEQVHDLWRKKAMQLEKSHHELEMVLKKYLAEAADSKKDRPPLPIKVTRSVGLQVTMPNMMNGLKSNSLHPLSRKQVHSSSITKTSPTTGAAKVNSNQKVESPTQFGPKRNNQIDPCSEKSPGPLRRFSNISKSSESLEVIDLTEKEDKQNITQPQNVQKKTTAKATNSAKSAIKTVTTTGSSINKTITRLANNITKVSTGS